METVCHSSEKSRSTTQQAMLRQEFYALTPPERPAEYHGPMVPYGRLRSERRGTITNNCRGCMACLIADASAICQSPCPGTGFV